jgi:hypothetical protein
MKQNPEPERKKVTLEFEPGLWRRVKDAALDNGTNFRTIVIRALESYLPKKKGGRHA